MIPGVRRSGPQRLTVRVDASKCTGHGVCVDVAPQLFALDRFGYAYVLPGADALLEQDGEARVLAREAAVRCPADAILVDRSPDRAVAPAPPSPVGAGATTPRLSLVPPDAFESLADWRSAGGLAPVDVDGVVSAAEASGLAGHGGARFPVAAKWRACGTADPVVVVNGAEREPGTVKDRYLLQHRPYAVLDGARVAATVVGAREIVVAIDEADSASIEAVRSAIDVLTDADAVDAIAISVTPVPARYVTGEETALLEAIEGREPRPHVRPPYPTTRGYRARPTLIHNVETLVQVALVAAHDGVDAGTTGLFSVSRFGGEPVVREHAYGAPVRALVESAGLDNDVQAVIVGGWSGGVLPAEALDIAATHPELVAAGASLGTKAVQVLGADDCVVGVGARVLRFFAGETAGQCPPCHEGLPYLADVFERLEAGTVSPAEVDEALHFAGSLPGRGACALPDGAVRFVRSLSQNFPREIKRHLAGRCHREESA